MPNVLIVDDESSRVEYLTEQLNGSDSDPYTVEHVRNWVELEQKLRRRYDRLDLVVFDVHFNQLDNEHRQRDAQRRGTPLPADLTYYGYQLLEDLRQWEKQHWQKRGRSPQFIKAILTSAKVPQITGRESELDQYLVETYSYTEDSPTDPGLVQKIRHICPSIEPQRISEWKRLGIVCGQNRKMYELMCQAEVIAQQDCHVWIDGKTGVGKELMARFIHKQSDRAKKLESILTHLIGNDDDDDDWIGELRQLNRLGAGIFGRTVSKLQDKINVDMASNIEGFGRIEDKSVSGKTDTNLDNQENFVQTLNELTQILDEAEVSDRLKHRISVLEREFKNQEYYVAQCLYRIAKLWQESQQQRNLKRRPFNFFDINCATFPDDKDLQINLFGVPAGIYTDVKDAHPGVLKATSYAYGTLFLDEIAELSAQAQSMLLRVLQEQEFRRLNSNISEKINIRVIAATNADIYQLVRDGAFREDLLMRLMQARIEIPPLSERMEDFDELVDFFLKRKQQEYQDQGEASQIEFDPQCNAISYMKAQGQPWRGNIRALQNVVERAYETARIERSLFIDVGHVRQTLDFLKKVETPDEQQRDTDFSDNIPIEDIKQWLEKAVPSLDIGDCTHTNLQDLIRTLVELFFQEAVQDFVDRDGNWNRRYARISETLETDSRDLSNPKELISLKMKDVLDELLKPYSPQA